jgi:hypothetical protein
LPLAPSARRSRTTVGSARSRAGRQRCSAICPVACCLAVTQRVDQLLLHAVGRILTAGTSCRIPRGPSRPLDHPETPVYRLRFSGTSQSACRGSALALSEVNAAVIVCGSGHRPGSGRPPALARGTGGVLTDQSCLRRRSARRLVAAALTVATVSTNGHAPPFFTGGCGQPYARYHSPGKQAPRSARGEQPSSAQHAPDTCIGLARR